MIFNLNKNLIQSILEICMIESICKDYSWIMGKLNRNETR